MFGTDGWRATYESRRAGEIDGATARAGYVNLMRWRLEQGLGYEWTHPLEIKNLKGNAIYHMILATDNPAGTNIMGDLYTEAVRRIPRMRRRPSRSKVPSARNDCLKWNWRLRPSRTTALGPHANVRRDPPIYPRSVYEWLPHDVELRTDTSSAHWVVSRLAPWGHDVVRVASFMPDAFEAYARVFHSAGDRGGESVGVRWSEVAERLSRRFHPEVQFRDLAGINSERHPVLGDIEPSSGSLPLTLLRSMVGFFERRMDEGELCWFAMWDGNGTWWKGAHSTLTTDGSQGDPLDDERDAVLRSTPRVHTQHRDYFLMRGPLASVIDLYDAAGHQSPALWWPDSRAWFVSTEVDAFSTYVGGSGQMIDELLRSDKIEAVRISLDAPLDWGL
jgi:hypothetical protein